MATLITLVDTDFAVVAPVNANFVALNSEIAGASRTGYATSLGVVNSGSSATDLHSWTMPASTITAAGDGFLIETHFTFNANANTKTVTLKLGTGTALTLNSTTAPNNKDLLVSLVVISSTTSFSSGSLIVTGTPVLCNAVTGASPAMESALSLKGAVAGTFASPIVVKFIGTGGATGDITQSYTMISLFKVVV